jgi:glycosyltransferase involved in cell wall biosynthesis
MEESMNRWVFLPFWLGFSFVALVGLIVQLLLPEIFPNLFFDGILKILNDPIIHHEYAIRASSMSWDNFIFLPKDGLIFGVQSFLYKAFNIHHPLIMLPFLAALGGVSIRVIASCLDVLGVKGRWWPLLLGLFLMVTPTSLSWMIYSYNDSLVIPGFLLIVWSFLAVTHRKVIFKHFISFFVGNILVVCSNSDLAPILLLSSVLASLVILVSNFRTITFWKASFIVCTVGFYGLVATLKPQYGNESLLDVLEISSPIESLNYSREKFLTEKGHAFTNFLPDVHNEGLLENIAFIPKALQLSLLEPLPWRESDRGETRTILFKLVQVEMFVVYFSLVSLIFLGFKGNKISMIVCLAFAIPAVVALGIAVPNIGTINRYRFPFLLLIKMAALAALWNSSRHRWPGRLLMWVDPPTLNRKKKEILFLVPDDATFIIQRLVMAQGAQKAGYDVHVASEDTGASDKIRELGFTFHRLDLNRGGLNPFADFKPFLKLIFFLAKQRPDILQCVSIKPVLYGATAGTIVGLKRIVCLINGMGYAFEGHDFKGKIVKRVALSLYRNALALPGIRVIFQNPDDQAYFIDNKLVDAHKTILIRGSGVNMEKFCPTPLTVNPKPIILFVGRLLWNKGLKELIEAARVLKAENLEFTLKIVGAPDKRNPEAVPESYLKDLHQEGIVDWVGRQSDMPKFYRESDIVCLPTQYKEGLPLTLLEAASTGRALVATDVAGCREIVRTGINGFLVPPKTTIELTDALRVLVLDPELRKTFGMESSRIVKEEFSAEIIQEQLVSVYESLLNDSSHSDNNSTQCLTTSLV